MRRLLLLSSILLLTLGACALPLLRRRPRAPRCLCGRMDRTNLTPLERLASFGVRASWNSSAAQSSLKAIASAQGLYRRRDTDGDGTLNFASLAALGSCSLVDGVLALGEKQGYRFEVFLSQDRGRWVAIASPTPCVTGCGYYAIDASGVLQVGWRPLAVRYPSLEVVGATPLP